MMTAERGHAEVLHLLIDNGASVNHPPLFICAVKRGNQAVVNFAIELGCALDDCDSEGKNSPDGSFIWE